MTLSPERNDVDISSLFFYKKPVTLTGNDKELTVYMRLVGDAELHRARVKALRDSRKLRDALKDKTSDEYLAFIPDIEDVDKDRLVELSLVVSLKEISAEVAEETDVPFPEEPKSGASLEEQEAYQKEIDEYPDKREKIIRKKILERAAEFKEELKERTLAQLKKDYLASIVNELCEAELAKSFYDHIIFFSLYKNDKYKEPLFENFEEYLALPSDVKEMLLKEYKNLELGMDELKK